MRRARLERTRVLQENSRGRTRTCDPTVNSRLLYQLSYAGLEGTARKNRPGGCGSQQRKRTRAARVVRMHRPDQAPPHRPTFNPRSTCSPPGSPADSWPAGVHGGPKPRHSGRPAPYTLNRTCTRSPSATTYSFPSTRSSPTSFTACSEPYSANTSYGMISARMKPRSRSL